MNETKSLQLSLSRIGTKAKDEEVLSEFVLTFTGGSTLDLSSVFGINIPAEHFWKSISLDVSEKTYKMKFDGMDPKNVVLKSVKLSKKETKAGDVFTTALTFTKDVDSFDNVFTNSYLKRKEDEFNEKGKAKKVTVYYDVEFSRI